MPVAQRTRKTDLSAVEALVLERILGTQRSAGIRVDPMTRIQQLTAERQQLYARSAAHPMFAATNGARIRALGAEIDRLWGVVRRERAMRRAQIERALHVDDVDDGVDQPESEPYSVTGVA